MGVFRLSYYSLPIELQICFRYCSIFPQDYEFEKNELIQMWMGSGLISQHASRSQTFEDIGIFFLVQLNKKSFFDLRSRVDVEGRKQAYYVMHDLMHDLARNVSSGECARVTHPAMFEYHNCTVRHMCVANIHNFSVDEVRKISNFKYLRTIIIDDSKPAVKKDVACALERVVESLKFLRLFCSRLTDPCHNLRLTDKCGKLKHLRYLRLQQISPEGICGVVRLYHLMLFYCSNVTQNRGKPVAEMKYLGNLDHLRYVSYRFRMLSFQLGHGGFSVARLTHLQELYDYRIEETKGNKLSALKSLRTICMLQVIGLENVKSPEEAKDVKLNEIISLYFLSLSWSFTAKPNNTDELVLNHLQPHCSVRELAISGYNGIKLPFWIEDLSIKYLVSLKLTPHASSCGEEDHLVQIYKLVVDVPSLLLVEPLKRFSRTTELHITEGSHMESLPERWLIQNRQFLRCLWITRANSLKSLGLSMRELSSLQELAIIFCHSELLNELRENKNSESNKVSHIRRVEIVQLYSHGTEGRWSAIMGKECDRETYDRLRFKDVDVLTSWVNQPNDDKAVVTSRVNQPNDDEEVESPQPW